jgi:hypothetical protein
LVDIGTLPATLDLEQLAPVLAASPTLLQQLLAAVAKLQRKGAA